MFILIKLMDLVCQLQIQYSFCISKQCIDRPNSFCSSSELTRLNLRVNPQARSLQLLRGQVQVVHEPGGGRCDGGGQGDRQAGEPVQQAPPRAGGVEPAARVVQRAGHGVPPAAPRPRPRRRGGGRRGGRGRRRRRGGSAAGHRAEEQEAADVPVPAAERAHHRRPDGEEPARELVQVPEVLLHDRPPEGGQQLAAKIGAASSSSSSLDL